MSLYGDLPPPTHATTSNGASDEDQQKQSVSDIQSANPKTKQSALPAGWASASLRFMPQRKPVVQAKPRLVPRVTVASSTTTVASSVTSAAESKVLATTINSSASATQAKQPSTSEDVNEFKPAWTNPRVQRTSFDKKKANKGVKKQTPLRMEDDYDPTRPNDYEEYKELEKRRREELSRRYVERKRHRSNSPESDKHSPSIHFAPPSSYADSPPSSKASELAEDTSASRLAPAKVDLDISGEEAYLRRARLSSKPAVTENTLKTQPEVRVAGLGSGEEFAQRMLAKYGWQEGQGLGKSEQGISEPLIVQKTDARTAIISNVSTNSTARFSDSLATKANTADRINSPPDTEAPSRVVLLTNMVGPGEVDDTLQEETADECNEKYGTVERCLIFEVPNGQLSDDEAVRIFVKFVGQEAAVKAKRDLNGRFFGGRAVTAKFFDEGRFDRLDLAPSPSELQRAKKKDHGIG
ncbi:11148_t:CDS:2 [Paraglomus brasilianum]|uniref:11148_t:CDS:1 n=1 Tax=Paraglomus brasilianum TaxID=144538 RepID=A0A9N8VSA5_9GLOM|nr:11148_t:CDS:2 [Paraglomus brasilianum]